MIKTRYYEQVKRDLSEENAFSVKKLAGETTMLPPPPPLSPTLLPPSVEEHKKYVNL